MKRIPLTQGQFALVDDEDFELVSGHLWYALLNKQSRTFYAIRRGKNADGHRGTIYMHRVLMGANRSCYVDHENHNGLDNRRRNLRLCTGSQNSCNRRVPSNNNSGLRGVHWNKKQRRWIAQIAVRRKTEHLGTFSSKSAADMAYDRAATEIHGEFAMTNKKLGLLKRATERRA